MTPEDLLTLLRECEQHPVEVMAIRAMHAALNPMPKSHAHGVAKQLREIADIMETLPVTHIIAVNAVAIVNSNGEVKVLGLHAGDLIAQYQGVKLMAENAIKRIVGGGPLMSSDITGMTPQ